MGQSITPIAYRVGFFRVWDSLYTESLYLKNYNFFLKSQMLCLYTEGFFNKWTWDGRRSYFLNFIFSHLEISWSFNFVHLYVYVYNSGIEFIHYKLRRELFQNKKFVKSNNVFFSFFKKSSEVSLNKYMKSLNYLMNFYFKYMNIKKGFKSLSMSKQLVQRKKLHKKLFDLQLKNKKKNFIRIKNFIKKLALFKQRFFNDKGIIKRFGVELLKNKTRKYIYNIVFVYIFLKKLIKLRFYKTYLNFSNYFFFIKPVENALKRHFFKDFYYLLGLNKFKNIDNNFNISLIRLLPSSVTAATYARHIWLKLYKKYHFGKVIYSLLRNVRSSGFFKGLLVRCNGRFTKKQRAWHSVYRHGKMPLSKQSALVDDTVIYVKLRYGISAVHINLNYT